MQYMISSDNILCYEYKPNHLVICLDTYSDILLPGFILFD